MQHVVTSKVYTRGHKKTVYDEQGPSYLLGKLFICVLCVIPQLDCLVLLERDCSLLKEEVPMLAVPKGLPLELET